MASESMPWSQTQPAPTRQRILRMLGLLALLLVILFFQILVNTRVQGARKNARVLEKEWVRETHLRDELVARLGQATKPDAIFKTVDAHAYVRVNPERIPRVRFTAPY